jgi:hypothetical protein
MTCPAPLVGFNDDLHYRGERYHVQTEDSGLQYPHVVTHLFASDGHILRTLKSSYAEHLTARELEGMVRALMVKQHKAMCAALLRGRLDVILAAPRSLPTSGVRLRTRSLDVSDLPGLIACSELVVGGSLDDLLIAYMALSLGNAA